MLSLLLPFTAAADSHNKLRPTDHAPIGVMGDHTHAEGDLMLSYRYMFMDMDGNRSGTNRVSSSDVLSQYMVTPTDMDMHMHMLGFMYAPTDYLTLMAMVPYTEISMNHLTRSGMSFKTRASGLADISITGLWSVFKDSNHSLHLNTGVSLPSGEIDERDDTPAGPDSKLPYPMQIGSGTVDLLPGITYLGNYEEFSFGAQVTGTVRLGENDNDYTLGNQFNASLWGAYNINEWISPSVRFAWQSLGNIDGADPDLNPMMIPTADPSLRGGNRLDLGLGINLLVPKGSLKNFRLALELLFPLYQDLDGPQLETDLTIISGIQYAF